VLRSRGLLDEGRLSQLRALYTSDLGSQYAGDPADAAVTELLATRGLSLLLAQVRSVQPFAPAVAAALSVLDQPTFHPQQVARELTSDRELSARLQGMARMPWFAEGVVGRSAAALVGSLGQKRMRELLLALTFVDVFQQNTLRSPLTTHSVGVAAIAHTLARWSGAVEPTFLGVAGLWHDVGGLLFCRSPELDRAVLGSDEQEFPTSSHLIERLRFGFDHAVLGELGLRLWGFPDELALAVGLHHYHRPPAGTSAAGRATLGLLEAADLFEHGFAANDSSQLARVEGLWSRFELADVLSLNQVRVRWRQLRDARAEALVAFDTFTAGEPSVSHRVV
jgi:HD-like signal output (HDOD) protein